MQEKNKIIHHLLKKINSNKLRLILYTLVALFLFFLMISFSFPDLFSMHYLSYWVSKGNVDIYDLAKTLQTSCPWISSVYYPPLYYLSYGFYLKLIMSLGILSDKLFTLNNCPVWSLILNKSFLFWIKLPYLLIHLASGIIFSKFFNKKSGVWLLLWLTNPISLFVTFIQGQYEIIPVFFLLLSLYFAKTKKPFASTFVLGIGAAYKHYPFLVLIPFVILLGKNWRSRISLLITALVPYIIFILPYINSHSLASLQFSDNFKMFSVGIALGNGSKISFYIVTYVLLTLKLLFDKKRDWIQLTRYVFLFSLIYFIYSFWYVQRLLFLLPSLLLIASKYKKVFISLPFLYLSYFAYILFLYPGLFDQGLLRPIITNINTAVTPFTFVTQLNLLSGELLQTITFSTITAFFIWFGLLVLRQSPGQEVKINPKDVFLNSASLLFYIAIIFSFALFT